MVPRIFFLLFLLIARASSLKKNEDEEDVCGLYLAVSSTATAEFTTWGVYAGKDIAAGESVGYPDLGVSLLHLKANSAVADMTPQENDESEENAARQQRQDFLTTIVSYVESLVWVPGPAGAAFELATGKIISSIPGIGALGAFNPKLTNAAWDIRAPYARTPLGETPHVNHPGRGAYTPFYNITVKSMSEMKAGTEIFMDYGSSWEQEEAEDDLEAEDFDRLDETIAKMMEFFEKHKDTLDEESKLQVYHFITKDVMKAAVGDGKSKRIGAMLPPSPDYLHKIPDVGGSLYYSEPNSVRPMDWLQEHGRCMDHIKPGASTIPNAGRGAFATRKISSGGLVSPMPLIHLSDKAVLDMYDLVPTESGEYIRESDEKVGQQMLLNYVFGHPQSTMVFIPTGSVASFINHSDEPNAKIIWSTHPGHQKVWATMDPSTLVEDEYLYLGLMLEVVALRDIQPGEEVFIDYQDEWKAAWKKHVETWETNAKKGTISKDWPVDASDLNAQYANQPIPTAKEQKGPYPENVSLQAFLMTLGGNDKTGTWEDPLLWGANEDDNIFVSDHLRQVSVAARTEIKNADGNFSSMPYNYTIAWESSDGALTYVTNIPQEAFVFTDRPGTSAQFVQEPFRHYIGIPDEIFPQGPWRNVA